MISMVFSGFCYCHYFFNLHQQNKFSESKIKFRQASNRSKRVFETAKREYANETKETITSHKLGFLAFGEVLIVFSTKVNPLYFLHSTIRMCCIQHPIKQNCFLKTFLRTPVLTTQVSLYLHSLLELI